MYNSATNRRQHGYGRRRTRGRAEQHTITVCRSSPPRSRDSACAIAPVRAFCSRMCTNARPSIDARSSTNHRNGTKSLRDGSCACNVLVTRTGETDFTFARRTTILLRRRCTWRGERCYIRRACRRRRRTIPLNIDGCRSGCWRCTDFEPASDNYTKKCSEEDNTHVEACSILVSALSCGCAGAATLTATAVATAVSPTPICVDVVAMAAGGDGAVVVDCCVSCLHRIVSCIMMLKVSGRCVSRARGNALRGKGFLRNRCCLKRVPPVCTLGHGAYT